MKYIVIVLFMSLFQPACKNTTRENNTNVKNTVVNITGDSVQASISLGVLKAKVSRYTDSIKTGAVFSDGEYIETIRIYNTIQIGNLLSTDSSFLIFDDIFTKKCLPMIVEKFKPSLNKGMGFYIQKHDLHIGGLPNENSLYLVEK